MVLRQYWWDSLSLGLLVEGQSDQDTIPILAKRLGYDARIRARVVSRGQMLASNAISRYLTKFLRESRDVTRVIICLDAERENPAQVLASTRPIERRLNETLTVSVRYAVVDHALEGWLACDEEAIQVCARWSSRLASTSKATRKITLLQWTFSKGSIARTGETSERHATIPKIAQFVTPERIAARSPTFRRFAEMLGHPVSG